MEILEKHVKRFSANLEARIQVVVILMGFLMPPFILRHYGISINLAKEDFSAIWAKVLYQVYVGLGQYGEYLVSIILGTSLWGLFRKRNKEEMFNKGNAYKDHTYAWYWFCAKVLGYSKCNLERVPIYTQFRLVLRDTFDEYDVGEIPAKEDMAIGQCWLNPLNGSDKEVNLMIADTYPLSSRQLPVSKNTLATVKIYRQNQIDRGHYYTAKLVETVLNTVKNLPADVEQLNIFATTNPKNTYEIVKSVFKSAGRDNIRVLKVFQQQDSGTRNFEEKGKTI